MIIHAYRPIDGDFVKTPNEWARDRRLTRRARGLLTELMSHRSGWEVSLRSLQDGGPEGRDAVQASINELQRLGYLRVLPRRGAGGRLGAYDYEISDPFEPAITEPLKTRAPVADPLKTRSSVTEPLKNRMRENPVPENPRSKKTISKKTNNKKIIFKEHQEPRPAHDVVGGAKPAGASTSTTSKRRASKEQFKYANDLLSLVGEEPASELTPSQAASTIKRFNKGIDSLVKCGDHETLRDMAREAVSASEETRGFIWGKVHEAEVIANGADAYLPEEYKSGAKGGFS